MTDYFCFDENISTHLVTLLVRIGVNGCHITEHLPTGTKDPEVIAFICEKKWVLVSGDPRMRKVHSAVLAQHKIRAIFLPEQYIVRGIWWQCEWFFKNWKTIQEEYKKNKVLHVRVTERGKLEP